ncbi:melatonin receptor type 1B-like [Acropora palmata]|uniref:melatonin receptor type 1B-like n=1 Tax=Acropora palmata TaxID=6131 RepID=UPI003DA1C4E4
MDFDKWNPFWATCFGVMCFLIIVGNSLTILTYLKKNFRKGPHFLLISLAFADLLVGCTIPLYMAGMFVLSHKPEILSYALKLAVCTSVSSIFHLPLSLTAYWIAIATPWLVSLFLTIPAYVLRWSEKRSNLVFFVIAFLTTPLLITCFSYIVIWKKGRESRGKVRSFRQNQEGRFSRIIFLVTVASFVTWMPFQLCTIVKSLALDTFIPSSVFLSVRFLQFSNSFVNFVIYFLRFPSYRKALFSMFSCKAPNHRTVITPAPSSGEPRSSRVFEF